MMLVSSSTVGLISVGKVGNEPVCERCLRAMRESGQDGRRRILRILTGARVRQESRGNSGGFFDPPRTQIGHGSYAAFLNQHPELAAPGPLPQP